MWTLFPFVIRFSQIKAWWRCQNVNKNLSNLLFHQFYSSDLGVHVDGFIALVAHTIVVGATADKQVEGRAADVVLAAYNAIQAAFRMLRPGKLNNDVTKVVQKVADSYKCSPLEGVLSHELKKHLIDGNNVIINKETFEQKVEEREFQVNEVFGLDVIVSTGEGKAKEVIFEI